MDTSFLLTSVLNGVMSSRGKSSQRARRHLTGRAGGFLSNPATLMTAAGLAWGVFETLRSKPPANPAGAGNVNPLAGMPPTPDLPPPDRPVASSAPVVSAPLTSAGSGVDASILR